MDSIEKYTWFSLAGCTVKRKDWANLRGIAASLLMIGDTGWWWTVFRIYCASWSLGSKVYIKMYPSFLSYYWWRGVRSGEGDRYCFKNLAMFLEMIGFLRSNQSIKCSWNIGWDKEIQVVFKYQIKDESC